MAQQPDFRDGLYGPDDGPYEVLTFPTMSIPNLFFADRRIVIKVSWPRDLPATLTFPGPEPVGEVCDPPLPPAPPPPIGIPPPPKPPDPHCYPDPDYQPYPGGPNGGTVPPPERVSANPSYPYPLIVWSHGPNEPFRNYYHLVHHLVSHGYVVVQVQHYDATELKNTPITDEVNQSIEAAYTAGHPRPAASDYSAPIGAGPGTVQLAGGPCYYRWVGSNATLINTLADFGLDEPYLTILGLAVQPFFAGVADTVGSLVGAEGLRLEYQCFAAAPPDSLFDVPGWYFIPQLGGTDLETPAGQYWATTQDDGGPVVPRDCAGDGNSNPIESLLQAPLQLACATRSATTIPIRNNTIRYTRWLRDRSADYMGLLQDYLNDLQAWRDGLQVCTKNASILDRRLEVLSVLWQITSSPYSGQGTVAASPQLVDEMIDEQRGIQGRYTFAPGTPEQVIMENNGVCPEPEDQQGDPQAAPTVPYCVLRDDVLQGKIDISHIGLGGFAQGAAAVVDMVDNPPADATWSPAFFENCSFYGLYSYLPFARTMLPKALPLQVPTPPEAPPPEGPTSFAIMPVQGYFMLDPQYSNDVYRDDYSWTFFNRPMMEVLSPGGNDLPFQNSPLGDKYLATISGTEDYFGGIRRRPEDECPPGDTSYPCTRDDGFYNELTNPKVADYVQSLALAFFDAHVHYDEQNRRRPARTFLKSNQVTEATGQGVQYRYK